MSNVLIKICAEKRREITAAKAIRSLSEVKREAENENKADPPRGFINALENAKSANRFGLIAEIKKASPSAGLIRADFDPAAIAAEYASGGASCLSVLTDAPNFHGEPDHLKAARFIGLPVLRKDFMLDPYQVFEARAMGADCILIILAAVSDAEATALEEASRDLGMDVLAEVHDEIEVRRALKLKTRLIGINNRNLRTLRTNLATTESLAPLVPKDRLLVSESGLSTPEDLERMWKVDVGCFLIGEALLRKTDIRAATAFLLQPPIAKPIRA